MDARYPGFCLPVDDRRSIHIQNAGNIFLKQIQFSSPLQYVITYRIECERFDFNVRLFASEHDREKLRQDPGCDVPPQGKLIPNAGGLWIF